MSELGGKIPPQRERANTPDFGDKPKLINLLHDMPDIPYKTLSDMGSIASRLYEMYGINIEEPLSDDPPTQDNRDPEDQ